MLDFSWVIAGPTTTRYLAAMGAEVIKVEAPGSGDPGRASELHTVLGQAKKSIALDLKKPQAVEIARALAAKSDILIENFATGVMDRLGLGAEALKAVNPDLIYISASGMGRTGPESHAVAYGTLLQCYAGFAGLNRHPEIAPRVGFAWLDPMCGLMLAFIAAAALWHRQRDRRGGARRFLDDRGDAVDDGRAAARDPARLTAEADGQCIDASRAARRLALHGRRRLDQHRRADGDGMAALCAIVPGLSGWPRSISASAATPSAPSMPPWPLGPRADPQPAAAEALLKAGIPAAALARYADLVQSPHLAARAFWDKHGDGVLPGIAVARQFRPRDRPRAGTRRGCRSGARDVLGLSPNASPSCGRAERLARPCSAWTESLRLAHDLRELERAGPMRHDAGPQNSPLR